MWILQANEESRYESLCFGLYLAVIVPVVAVSRIFFFFECFISADEDIAFGFKFLGLAFPGCLQSQKGWKQLYRLLPPR